MKNNGIIARSRLGDVTSHISSGSTPRGGESVYLKSGPVMLIRSQNVRMNRLDLEDVAFISDKIDAEMKRSVLLNQDVLLNITGASIGRVAQFDLNGVRANVNQHVCIIRPVLHKLDSRFLTYYLSSPQVQHDIGHRHQHGGTRQALTFAQIAEFELPLPPLSEQKRIADLLDKADVIRRKRREAVVATDKLISSEFASRFGDPVLNSKHFPQVPLATYGQVTTGNTPPREDPENYGDSIEWIKSDNINTPNHFITKATEGLSEKGLSLARTVAKGSTLVTCIAGSRDCVGNVAMTDRTVAFNQQINAITPSPSTDPLFLYALILLSKPLVQKASTDSMKGMVSKGKFEQVRVIEVPPAAQEEFGKIFHLILRTLENLNAAQSEADDMFNSLVQRAFRGDL